MPGTYGRERRQETTAVKRALLEAGIPVRRVIHGRGTAWGWLDIYLEHGACRDQYETGREAIRIAQEVTGRSGDYDGRINVG